MPDSPTDATRSATPTPAGVRWTIALVAAAVVLLLALGGVAIWMASTRPSPSALNPAAAHSAFASAMSKAGVRAPSSPATPVPLSGVNATGAHSFDATFTPAELTALLDAFSFSDTAQDGLTVSRASVTQTGDTFRLAGKVDARGSSYNGWVEGRAGYSEGMIVAIGGFTANAEGISVGGSQAAQAGMLLVAYLNDYLKAAPGLRVSAAEVSPAGVHVTGTAPDAISW